MYNNVYCIALYAVIDVSKFSNESLSIARVLFGFIRSFASHRVYLFCFATCPHLSCSINSNCLHLKSFTGNFNVNHENNTVVIVFFIIIIFLQQNVCVCKCVLFNRISLEYMRLSRHCKHLQLSLKTDDDNIAHTWLGKNKIESDCR